MDKVVHFEIPAEDLERSKKFYAEVFGWKLNDIPEMKYITIETAATDPETRMIKEIGSINGGMMQRADKIKNPVITIDVADIDSAMAKVKQNGGEEVMAKMEVGDMGWASYFKDTEGNILGLWQNKPQTR